MELTLVVPSPVAGCENVAKGFMEVVSLAGLKAVANGLLAACCV
jgi:hypothetical protein